MRQCLHLQKGHLKWGGGRDEETGIRSPAHRISRPGPWWLSAPQNRVTASGACLGVTGVSRAQGEHREMQAGRAEGLWGKEEAPQVPNIAPEDGLAAQAAGQHLSHEFLWSTDVGQSLWAHSRAHRLLLQGLGDLTTGAPGQESQGPASPSSHMGDLLEKVPDQSPRSATSPGSLSHLALLGSLLVGHRPGAEGR